LLLEQYVIISMNKEPPYYLTRAETVV